MDIFSYHFYLLDFMLLSFISSVNIFRPFFILNIPVLQWCGKHQTVLPAVVYFVCVIVCLHEKPAVG